MAKFRINVKKRARILTRAEFKRVLKVCTITREVERNKLLMCLTHACGLRVTELGLITIRDVMFQSGRLKPELTLRAEITKNNIVRTVPISNEILVYHLELYLEHRIKNNIGMLPRQTDDFRNISPDLPLIFSSRGGGFAIATKKRLLESGIVEEYRAVDALEQTFRHLYKISGLKGASSHSGRRSYASRLVEQGVAIEDVSALLGHQSVDHTWPYLEVESENVRQAFEISLDGLDDDGCNLSSEEIERILKTIPKKKPTEKNNTSKENHVKKADFKIVASVDKYSKVGFKRGVAANLTVPAIPTAPHLLNLKATIQTEYFQQQVKNKEDAWSFIKPLSYFTMPPVSGLYFLISKLDEVVYVGQSTNLLVRISDHYKDIKKFPYFSKVAVLPVPGDRLLEIEGIFIQALEPRLNRGG